MAEGGRRKVLCIEFFSSLPIFWKIIMMTTAAAIGAVVVIVIKAAVEVAVIYCSEHMLGPFMYTGSVNSHTNKMYVRRLGMLKKPFRDKAIWGFFSSIRIWLLKALHW